MDCDNGQLGTVPTRANVTCPVIPTTCRQLVQVPGACCAYFTESALRRPVDQSQPGTNLASKCPWLTLARSSCCPPCCVCLVAVGRHPAPRPMRPWVGVALREETTRQAEQQPRQRDRAPVAQLAQVPFPPRARCPGLTTRRCHRALRSIGSVTKRPPSTCHKQVLARRA